LHPNPTSDFTEIDLQSASEASIDIILLNQKGDIVFQKNTFDKIFILNVSSNKFNSGIYTLVIRQADNIIKEQLEILKD